MALTCFVWREHPVIIENKECTSLQIWLTLLSTNLKIFGLYWWRWGCLPRHEPLVLMVSSQYSQTDDARYAWSMAQWPQDGCNYPPVNKFIPKVNAFFQYQVLHLSRLFSIIWLSKLDHLFATWAVPEEAKRIIGLSLECRSNTWDSYRCCSSRLLRKKWLG